MPRGGYRPNSGPKKGTKYKKRVPKNKVDEIDIQKVVIDKQVVIDKDAKLPLEYMITVINDESADSERRDRLAMAAAPYCHAKKGESGKKEDKEERAKKAGQGRFKPSSPPKLTAVK